MRYRRFRRGFQRGFAALFTLCLIVGLLLENAGYSRAAATTQYETISIASGSLNGNAVWGLTEDNSNVRMDTGAWFYANSSNRNSGVGGFPVNGSLKTGSGVPYQLACGEDAAKAYDGNDCIRLTPSYTKQTMNLETVGVYKNIYVLATAGGPGSGHYAKFAVTLNYSDGTSQTTEYKLYDWYDLTTVPNVEQYKNVMRISSGYEGSTYGAPILHSAAIEADPSRLLTAITFTMVSLDENKPINNLYCTIYAITGATPEGVPEKPVATAATDVNKSNTNPCFTANWEAVSGATEYRLDVAEDQNFTRMLSNYNNLNVGNATSYKVEGKGIVSNKTYYYRVRAVNRNGQSLSSNRIATGLPEWVAAAGVEDDQATYDPETGTLVFSKSVNLKAPIQLPAGETTNIEIPGGVSVVAAQGQPAIKASGSNVDLILTGSGTVQGGNGANGGNAAAAIDLSGVGGDSRISLNGNMDIQGGRGGDAADENGNGGNGGDAIRGGGNLSIEIRGNGGTARLTGGDGGSGNGTGNGGNGGAGVSGSNVQVTVGQNASSTGVVKGGNGGDANGSGNGGNGGLGVKGNRVTVKQGSEVDGGDGGNAHGTGNGGDGGKGVESPSASAQGSTQGGKGGDSELGNPGSGATAGTSGGASGEPGKAKEFDIILKQPDAGQHMILTADKNTATSKETVTLTVKPADGYIMEGEPSVTIQGATAGAWTKQADGSYTCTISGITGEVTVQTSGVTKKVYSDKELLAIVDDVMDKLTIHNETSKDQILAAVKKAMKDVEYPVITVDIPDFIRKQATADEKGSLDIRIALIKDGTATTVEKVYKKEIDKLPAVDPTHTHTYGEWSYDAVEHWKECTAADCYDLLSSRTEIGVHTAGDWIVDKEATLEEEGLRHKECSVCHLVLESEILPKKVAHTHWYSENWSYDDQNHWHACSGTDCPDVAGSVKDVAAHTESDWIVDVAATTETVGRRHKECVVCKKILTEEEIPVLEEQHTHVYSTAWSYDDNNHWHACACGDVTEVAAHTAGDWIVDTEPTKTTVGRRHKECTTCGKIVAAEDIPMLPHDHAYAQSWSSDADSHWHGCSCGDKIDIAAHTESDWIVDVQATDETAGRRHKECTICGRILETESIPCIPHTHVYGQEWLSDAENHWHACKCGDRKDVITHIYGDWNITRQPTETEEGEKERVCKVCGYKQIEKIARLNADNGSQNGTVENRTNASANAANANLNNTGAELADKVLTPEEKQRVQEGESVGIYLEVKDITGTVPQADRTKIESARGAYTIGMYLDVSLYKKIGNHPQQKVNSTNGKVTITLRIPANLRNQNPLITRSYRIYRVHNGKVDAIACQYDAGTQTITFETDGFSTYALAYLDQYKDGSGTASGQNGSSGNSSSSQNPAQGTGNGTQNATGVTNTKHTGGTASNSVTSNGTIKTGDDAVSLAAIWMILIGTLGMLFVYGCTCRFRRTRR